MPLTRRSQDDDLTAIFQESRLPAASSFMSSRWSEDNLITCHPARLYNGSIRQPIGQESLGYLLQELETTTGPLLLQSAHMGVTTWDVACESKAGPVIVQFPLVLDQPGARDRARSEVPSQNVTNMRHFIDQKLTRFVITPLRLVTLVGGVRAAIFTDLPDHHALTFGRGRLQVDLNEGEESWSIALGPRRTAELLTEMVAALAYHYEPETDGGTAIADVLVNDGDFLVKRTLDGGFAVRLKAVRKLEAGIGPNLFLLYLVQLNTFEDWEIDGNLSGLPTLISNPSIAFEGLVRGLRYRFRDRGRTEEEGERLGQQWVRDFARSRLGHAYLPWVERFLAGGLLPAFGEDPRERWWRLLPLRQKQSLRELSARQSGNPADARSAQEMAALLDRLSSELGRVSSESSRPEMRVNDLDLHGLVELLDDGSSPRVARQEIAAQLLAHWPFRSMEHLLARVPRATALGKLPLVLGQVTSADDEGTLTSLTPLQAAGEPGRPLANPEVFGGIRMAASLEQQALNSFPSFEAFMDMALHDEKWGYYATSVVIGKGGHFSTHPESFSPHYGEWVCRVAFQSWRDMCAHGELGEDERFSVIEFGAGNGRLARDFLDAVTKAASTASQEQRQWQAFAARLEYRIYDLSSSLREKQRTLLGRDAVIAEGDARRPADTLKHDFPQGVRGIIVTNEVPDAFGVHKVVLTRDGQALVALVVPRVEPGLRHALGDELAGEIAAVDARLRQTFELSSNPADSYLDAETYARLMEAVAAFPSKQRQALLCKLWIEEAYVPASGIPALGAHLRENAGEYAIALAAEDSGVVLYVNVHAGRFIQELGASLAAGSIVTIDYGETTWGLVQGARRGDFPFRVYLDGDSYMPRPNDPYTCPGTQDMTADVNFTELANAGRNVGLSIVHYGLERDLAGGDLPELLRASSDSGVAAFLGDGVFKVLVLGTRPTDLFQGPLSTPLPLWVSERDLPSSRQGLVPVVRSRLAGLLE